MPTVHIPSYPSSYALGHKAVAGVLDGTITVQEKLDGSQFSWGIINNTFVCKSKKVDLDVDAPERMFAEAVDVARSLYDDDRLENNTIYRAEYLKTPQHNTLKYARIPNNHLMLFDIESVDMYGQTNQATPDVVQVVAQDLGLEPTPLLYYGNADEFGLDTLDALLETESVLGGCTIEGVVIKNYNVFTPEKKFAFAKYVSEAFKEQNDKTWKANKKGPRNIIDELGAQYTTEARWHKAVQHLRETGALDDSPRDIGPLIKELQNDTLLDCADDIKETLFQWAWPQITRQLVNGFPEWYKRQLAMQAFSPLDDDIDPTYDQPQ